MSPTGASKRGNLTLQSSPPLRGFPGAIRQPAADRSRWRWGFFPLALCLAAFACTLPAPGAEEGVVVTAARATLTARPESTGAPSTVPPAMATTSTPPPTATSGPTATPPPFGVSINCDGTYQRVMLAGGDGLAHTLHLFDWIGGEWELVWTFEAGDPAIRQLSGRMGLHSFGGCRRLLVVPLRYEGSGAVLELHIFAYSDGEVVEVYTNDGFVGEWEIQGDRLRFEELLYLYDEPTCCPCNRQVTIHRWDGTAFIEDSSEISPTYTGTPPPICQP